MYSVLPVYTVYREIFVVKKLWVWVNHKNLTHENFSTAKIYYDLHKFPCIIFACVYVVQLHLCQ